MSKYRDNRPRRRFTEVAPIIGRRDADKAQPRPQQPYLPNGGFVAQGAGQPGNAAYLPNNGRVMQAGGARVLCVADVRGRLFCRRGPIFELLLMIW